MKCRFGSFELDEDLWELRRRGQRVPIQRKALETILFLIRNRDRVVPRHELRTGLWPGTAVSDAAITHAIMQARRALDDNQECWIQTVRGRGIRFVGVVNEDPRSSLLSGKGPNGEGSIGWQSAPGEMDEFERQFLRCVHGLLGAVLDVTRPWPLRTLPVPMSGETASPGNVSAVGRRTGPETFAKNHPKS
jgi:DNA-binding winged helix-turn-helix (wHTH) protein